MKRKSDIIEKIEKEKSAVREAIEKLKKEHGLDASAISNILAEEAKDERDRKIREKCREKEEYVGKCFVTQDTPSWRGIFPVMNVYYEVISANSLYTEYVDCLVFDEYPCYWFNYKDGNGPGSYYLGEFDFESFRVESIPIRELKNEITKEEYHEAMYEYLFRLMNMEWIRDHSRQTGILPSDEAWKES